LHKRNVDGAEMINDDELAEIRRKKIQLMMERAQQPTVLEPLANGLVNELTDVNFNTVRHSVCSHGLCVQEWKTSGEPSRSEIHQRL